MTKPKIIETIICKKNGVYRPDGRPWGERSKPPPNIFETDQGAQYVGLLYRIQLGPQSWQWQTPQEFHKGQMPLF